MMKQKVTSIVFAAVTLSVHLVGNAFSITEYRSALRQTGSKQAIEMYVIGVGQGIFWSSVYTKAAGSTPVFCPPGDMTFTGDIILSVVNSGLKKSSLSGETSVELFMIDEFKRVFPC
jgi:hypothetical protein